MNGNTHNIKGCVKEFEEISIKNHNTVANGGEKCSGSGHLLMQQLFDFEWKVSGQTDKMPRNE